MILNKGNPEVQYYSFAGKRNIFLVYSVLYYRSTSSFAGWHVLREAW